MIPGRRLRLHPDDYYACGGHRGGINERWFSSTTNADNGPGTPADEGLSYVRLADGKRFLLKEAVEKAGDLLHRRRRHAREKGWNLLCKFFDNLGPDPASHAPERHGRQARRPPRKTRSVLLPAAVQPDGQQLSRTRSWDSNRERRKKMCGAASRTGTRETTASPILSRAYRLERGTGWQINPGILHAPGSF